MREKISGKLYDTGKGIAIAFFEEDEIEYELYLQKTKKEDRWFILRTFYCGNQEICHLNPGSVKNWLEIHRLDGKLELLGESYLPAVRRPKPRPIQKEGWRRQCSAIPNMQS